jgi:ABC-type Na+ efflux pump permease subunit
MSFIYGERSSFVVYGLLVLVWSSLIASNIGGQTQFAGTVWWIFFSVIISGNFGNTVFIAERLSGSMEILLVSGLSRKAILFGKMLFVIAMTAIIGAACYGLALLWLLVQHNEAALNQPYLLQATLYMCASAMNAASSAWLTTRLPNPRLAHFANLLGLACVIGVYAAMQAYLDVSPWWLAAVLLAFAALFARAALKDFYSERIIRPITL